MTKESARGAQMSSTRVGLRGSVRTLARLLAVAIVVSGGLVIAVATMPSAPVTAQSILPTIAIQDPTTSYFFPDQAPSAPEGNTLRWTVTRTGSTSSELTVPLTSYRRGWRARLGTGTWVPKGHYNSFFEFTQENPKVESVTFPAGASQATISVQTTNDNLWERNAVLMICISDQRSDGEGVTYLAPNWYGCAAWRLINEDAPPLVTIAPDNATVSEGGRAAFTLTRAANDASQAEQITVKHIKVDSRGNVSAYSLSESVSFEPGELTKQHFVSLTDNNVRSDRDFYTLRVEIVDPESEPDAPVGNYRVESQTRRADIAVVDDDLPLVSVSAPASQTEETPVVFTFTRVDAVSMPLTIDVSLTETGDYLPPTVPTTFTFERNVTSKTLSLPVDDGVDEPDGSVTLTLSSTSAYGIATGSETTTVVITDDDEAQIVTLERDNGSVEEGNDATFTLTRRFKTNSDLATTGQAIERPLVVNVAVTEQGDFIDGTAPTSVTFAANSATATLTVPTVDDARPLPLEESHDSDVRFHSAYEDNGSITATVTSGTNYSAGLPVDNRIDPADDMTTRTIVAEDNEPPLVRATVIQNAPDGMPTTEATITEGGSASVYVKRYFYDNSQSLTVRFATRDLRCFDPAQPDVTQRSVIFRELPLTQGFIPGRVISVTIPAGQDSTTLVIPTSPDNAHECSVRWDVEVLAPAVPVDSTPVLWQQRYSDWIYHPLHPDMATITMDDDDDLPVITFTSPTVAEGVGTAEIVTTLRTEAITAGYATSWPIILQWWTIPGTASETADFTAVKSQSVTFPANHTGGTSEFRLRVPIVDDSTPEGSETLTIGYRLSTSFIDNLDLSLSGQPATVTITDDEPLPIISIPSSVTTEETAGSVVIALTLDVASELPITVNWTTEDNSAKSGSPPLDNDYVAASGTYIFEPGTTAGEVVIEIGDDRYDEPKEAFSIRLASPVNATLGNQTATIAITDDDRQPNVFLQAPSGVSEDGGIAAFKIELRDPNTAAFTVSGKEIVVAYSATDGGRTAADTPANASSDYELVGASLTIPAGSVLGTINVDIVDDANDEPVEYFTVTLGNLVNASLFPGDPGAGYTYIRDNDPPTKITIMDAVGAEPGDASATRIMRILVVLERASGKTLEVSYGTRDGSAKSLDQTPFTHDKDYAATSGTLTFAPGVTSKNIEVTINGDIYAESEEQFVVSLSSPVNAVIEDGVGTVTIQDGSRLPVILLEGVAPDDRVNEGFGFISVAFTLNHPDEIGIITSGRETTLDYTVTAFTPPENSNVRQAILGSDYYLRPASGTISFLPGENIARLTINILDDELEEPIERFMIRFDNPSNATFPRDADHLFTIIDNDPDPRIDVHDSRVREALGPMRFDVILANVSARDVSFDYNTQMGTAFEVEDYSYTQGRVIIPAGATTATIEVPIINDEEPEYIEEKFTLFLRNAEHGVLVNTEPVGYIIDDDQALQTGLQTKIVVSSADVVVAEGSSTGTSIDVRLSSAPTGSVAVTVSGTANTDLTAAPSSLTFDTSTWETDQTVTFTDASDLDAEDESHVIQLSASGGGYAGVGRVIQVTVEDDDTAGISVSHTSLTIDETGHGSFTVTLDTEPVDTVHTTITKSASQLVDLASVRLEQKSLSFTAADWQTPKMVTVHAYDDEDAINEHFELHLSGSGAGYAGLRTSVTVTVSDDDSPALVLADSEGNDLGSTPAIAMMERDSTSIKVALGTEPSAAVNVELTVARPAELTVDTDQTPGTVTLSFEVTDWHVPQRIQLTSLGDVDSAQDPAIPVAFSVTGGDYDNLTVPDLSVTITESDALGLVFSSDSIEVYEGDTTPATYTVRLGRQPLENPGGVDSVTVAISASAGSGLTVMPTSLTFIRSNWDNPQTVSVTVASDDDVDDATATLTNSTSGATEYAGISADVAVSIIDDDEQALVITPSPLSVNEGAMASYGVQLATRPTGEVVVVVSGHSGSDFRLDTTSLTFTISNWNVAQSVQVSAAQDDDAESDAVTLIHTASGSDYGGVTANVAVNTVEDEQEALTVSQTIISLAEGANATFSVALASRPSTSVTVNLSAPQGSGLTFDKASLTFSTGDWQTAQTVTITSSHDNDAANESVDVRLEVGSGAYGADAVVLQVAVIDDDAVGILLSDESLNVVEGVTTSYTVRLATQPSETVTVDIGLSVGADISVSTRQIAFNPNNWMSERTVTVVTRRDLDADVAPAITVTHTASNGDYDMVTKALTVTVSEVDVRGLVFLDSDGGTVGVSESLDIDEGDSTSYSVRLATQPSAQVVVTLSPGVGLSLNRTSLTFTSSDWIRAQTVTVTGSDDEDTSDGAAAIAHTIAGGGYDSVARSLEFVITDDDTAAILLTDSSGAALATDGLTVTEGATASYRVQLATQPSATVTVAISGTANTDLTTDETSLTFTGMNWNTPQTVEVRAGHDDDAITDAKATLSHAATGGEYESVTADLAVVIAEDDSDGFVVTDAAGDPLGGDTLTVDEGSSAAYKISLSAEPAGTVTVTLSGTGNTDLQLDKTELTFTATTWGTPQTVTATAARDDDVLDDRVILTHTPSGAGYAVPALSLNVVITDDDHQSVVLSVISLEIQERDTAIVGVSLGSVPTADVVVDLALSMGADLELPRTELTFTPQNWMTAQNVSVVSQHDDNGRDDAAQISFNANGGDYTSVLSILPVIIRDVDVPGIVLNLDALEVMEGLSADFTVELATEPSETVTITISGSSGTSLALSSTRLFFTSMDWSTRQTVTATAAHDNDIADEMIELNLTAEGGDYDPVTKSLTVTVVDDDPAVEVSFAQESYSVDEGLSVSVTVSLSEVPGRTVVIPITATPQGDATAADYSIMPPSVTFNTGQMSQTITFTAAQDEVDDDGESVLLGFGAPLPGGVSLGTTVTTTVSITDDDGAGVSVSESSLTIAEGGSGTYTIVLDSQPTADVTVTINDPSNTDVTAEPASLTFSSTDWNTPKTVTVNAAQDADAEDETATVTHTVTSTDSSYSGASANSVAVSVTDDEVPVTVQFGATTYEVVEGETVTVVVTLSADPERTVVIPITHTPQSGADSPADYTVPTSVTFNTGQMSQTITFTAAQDEVDDDGESVLLGFGAPLPGGVSLGTAVTTSVSITDDDVAGVSVSEASLTIAEGSSGTYTIVLDSQPTAGVAVAINDPSNTDVTAEPASLTFSSTDWNTPKTVTVNAAQDADAEDETATVTHTVTSTDSSYSGASANSVAVSVTDDEVPVTVQFGATTYEVVEGETVTVAVTLSADPERTVVIPITATPQDSASSADYSVPTSVTFNAGDMSKTITFTATQDAEDDDGESVLLAFGILPDGVNPGTRNETTVSITDDDVPQVTVSFGQAAYTVAEGGTQSVTVTLSADPERTVVVPITHTPQDGADSPADYTVPPSVTFNTGQMSQTITFEAIQDEVDDDGESVLLGFGTLPTEVSTGTTAATTVTITDDDDPQVTVSFERAAYTVAEGDMVTVTVTLSADPERTVVIPLVATEEGGASSEDYSGVPSSVTINAGETSKTFEFMAMADDASDTGESVMIGFGTSLPSRVTEGTPNEARVTINQVSTQFSLDCSLTATVWCADLGFSDRVAENYGWLYMRYGHGWDPPSSLSDDDFRFRGVDYDVRSMELQPGTHPVMPNAWSRWQQGYSSFRIGIYWDYRWGAPSEEHYRDWVLHLDGLELPFKDALRHGGDFVWVGAEFQQVFNDWTPSTVTKIGIEEVAVADQDTNPLLPWAPMQVDAWPEGPDRLLIVWAKPAWFYPGLPDPTSYIVQWKLASADWSDSAAVSQLEVAATSNFQAVIVKGMAENAVYSVRVIASNDAGDGPPSEETLGRPQDSVPRLIARTVNGQTLTLRFSEQLDPNAVPAATDFVVMADGGLIMVDSVAISGDEVILTLHHAVTAATHSVLVRYDKPTDPSAVFLQDTNGNYANIRQHHELLEVVNITPESSVQSLTAQFTNMPSSHDGRTRFTFDIEFSEPVWIGDGLARDDMLEITGGTVISAPWKDRRTDKFIVHVRPDTQGDIVIVLPGHRACHGIAGSYQEVPDPVAGAPCAIGSRVLTNEPTVTIPGPSSPAQQVVENTPAEGEPQINGIPEVGQTLSADTTAISDADGLENAVFQYQWLAEDADISGATGATYTVVSGDVGQAIRVRVTFTDDAGHEETLTSEPTVVTAGLQLQSATVDGAILTLTYSEVLDMGVTLPQAAFAVNVTEESRSLIGVGVGESNVLLFLSSVVEAGDTVTVDYTVPDGPDFIRDSRGRRAASFSGQAVTNDTASDPLTASVHDVPSSHNGQDAFTFELRFGADPKPGFSYTTVRDHAFTVTGGAVTYVRRLEPGKNVRWEIIVTPGSSADVTIDLNATTGCSAQGAICTEDGRMLSGGLLLAVSGPNTPATGSPTISGTAQVEETLTADITGISDHDGLYYATFSYQWFADDAEINGATASTYTLVADDEGKAIKVSVSFTDDAGNDEELTSAVTGAVVAAPPPPNTPATGLPTITGTTQVGETLTADITGISDHDGLDNVVFAYQWLADDAELYGANTSAYTLVADDEGKAIKVSVSFTDDAGNDEELTSAATGEVAAAVVQPPLTASVHDVPSSHNGQDAFIFELRLSEDPTPDFSYRTVWDHAFTVTEGSVTYVRRLEPGKNVRWEITVTPGSSADVTIDLNNTTDCSTQGAICTEDDRMLSGELEITVNGPGQ